MPSAAIASVAMTSMITSSIQGELSPAARRPTKTASAVKAPTVSTSPCENLMTSSTPKNSVKPTATIAYIMPSISPFMTYCANSPRSIGKNYAGGKRMRRVRARASPPRRMLLLARQLALAGGVLAVVPLDELAVLHHIFGDDRHGVLAVVVKGDLADDRVTVLHVAERLDHLLAVGPDL